MSCEKIRGLMNSMAAPAVTPVDIGMRMIMMVAGPALAVTLSQAAAAAAVVADKYAITANEHAACDSDAERLCAFAYPDEDKLLACMRASSASLTPLCRTTLRAGLRRRHMPL